MLSIISQIMKIFKPTRILLTKLRTFCTTVLDLEQLQLIDSFIYEFNFDCGCHAHVIVRVSMGSAPPRDIRTSVSRLLVGWIRCSAGKSHHLIGCCWLADVVVTLSRLGATNLLVGWYWIRLGSRWDAAKQLLTYLKSELYCRRKRTRTTGATNL